MSRQHIYVRPMDATNARDILVAERAMNDSGNHFPSGAFRLPSTQVMLAEIDGRVVAVQPFYRSLVMGSLAPVSSCNQEIASAMHQFTQAVYTDCHRFGLMDVLAFSDTPQTVAFAKRHGFVGAREPALRLEVR